MCTSCYGKHPSKVCRLDHMEWMSYIAHFMRNNQNVNNSMIGRWFEIAQKERRVPKETKPQRERSTETTKESKTNRDRHLAPEDNSCDLHKQQTHNMSRVRSEPNENSHGRNGHQTQQENKSRDSNIKII